MRKMNPAAANQNGWIMFIQTWIAMFIDSGRRSNRGTAMSTPAAKAVIMLYLLRYLMATNPPLMVENKVITVRRMASKFISPRIQSARS